MFQKFDMRIVPLVPTNPLVPRLYGSGRGQSLHDAIPVATFLVHLELELLLHVLLCQMQ